MKILENVWWFPYKGFMKGVNVILEIERPLRNASKKHLATGYQKNSYNPGHNILELSNILVPFGFTKSKTQLDI